MTHRRARIERVLTGVLRQAFADARTHEFEVEGNGAAVAFAISLLVAAGGRAGRGLRVHTASKTELLLGLVPTADVLLFGDLYHTQVASLIGPFELSGPAAELAASSGEAETLDRVLQRFFDDRLAWELAAAELPAAIRTELKDRLDAARFQRARVGLVPKLGSRTLGIDLFA